MDKKTCFTVSAMMIIVITLIAGIRAAGRPARIPDITNDYYRSIEREYISHVRETLIEQGFDNPGISMTKVVNKAGGFDYTISIHHRRIDKMDLQRRSELSALLTNESIPVTDSSVFVKYIEY